MRMTCFLLSLAMIGLAVPGSAGAEVKDESTPLPIQAERAFGNLRLRRPIVFTHADDGSDRVFIASQQGVIQFFENDQQVKKTEVFLDIESKVVYNDKKNEEGLLGFVFHPRYKENGYFFLYYTTTDAPMTSVVSRFRVSADNPNRADPASELELLRIAQPFWNHNGGGLAMGADGYLYIALGDGGKANDPFGNGQNLQTLLGSILRIDVDHTSGKKNYAIPEDNPFLNVNNARPEIWAYGVRNIWGMSFDKKTGVLWGADVGQNIWEEINLIERGGNYGWNLREAKHKFSPKGVGPRGDLIEPIWEYHHDIGKSITGGHVYRGKRVPELVGSYLYADYVSGKLWALKYDIQKKKVVANYSLTGQNMPIIAFGQDQQGESYFTDSFGMIYRFSHMPK